MLIPASVESNVWREIVWKKAAAIYMLFGRTRFCRLDGSTTTGRPLRSVALVTFCEQEAQLMKRMPFAGVFLQNWERR